MDETQYRVIAARGNMREEPDGSARIRATFAQGTLVQRDPDREIEDHWIPVLLVRGWMHDSVIQPVQPT